MIQPLAVILITTLIAWIALCVWDERELFRDAFKAIYGGSSGSTFDLAEQQKRIYRRIDNLGRIAFPGYERFEGWTQCPSCDRIAVHRMREPVTKTPAKQWESARQLGMALAQLQTETAYETIRICECGQEWGQR
jgi:hypothetical protein